MLGPPWPDKTAGVAPSGPDGWSLVLGPPGTGKTTTLLARLEEQLKTMPPDQIAFVSYTRAARKEAEQRAARSLGCGPEDLVWCRTIHSTAFRLLGLRSTDLMLPKDWRAFGDAHGYRFGAILVQDPDDDPGSHSVIEEDDALVATVEWGRSRMIPLEEAIRRAPFRADPAQIHKFVARYEAFKHENDKHDFTDLLERALEIGQGPPVRSAIIDEAQDLSPLQVALVERWFRPCERVCVAGDDDQAIYDFIGADSSWVLGLAESCPTQVLSQSYRVPRLAHELAMRVISQNRQRVEKQYAPRPAEGELVYLPRDDVIDELVESESTFVLGRNWRYVRGFANALRKRGVAFTAEKFPNISPLGATQIVTAFQAVEKLAAGREIPARHCEAVFKKIPSGKHGGGLLPRGAKKRAKENTLPVTLSRLREWGLDHLATAIGRVGPDVLLRVKQDHRDALRAIKRRYGRLPKPKIVLTSMHGSKGREADTVVILPDMSSRTFRSFRGGTDAEREAENRLAYVAATRTRTRLLVAHPRGDKSYPYEDYVRRVLPKRPEEKDEDDWWFG